MIAGILTRSLEREDNLQILKNLSYDGLQFDFNDLLNMFEKKFLLDEETHQVFQNFKNKIDNIGLPVLAFHTFYPLGELSGIVIENFKKYSRYMKELKCKFLILHVSAYSDNKADFENAIETLKEVKKYFLLQGQEILLENDHPPSLFINVEEIKKVTDKVKLNLCLDVSHALQSNLDLNNVFYELKDRIKAFHISDCLDGKTHLGVGEGVLKNQKCFREIVSSNALKVLEISRSLMNAKDRDGIIKVYSDSLMIIN